MSGWYSRYGSLLWLASSLMVIAAAWRMDVPSGTPTMLDGRVEAVESDGRLAVAIPGGVVKVESKTPYRRGDAVKVKKYATRILKRTAYEID